MSRIYLSPPHLSGLEKIFLQEALDSNWIAPLGPQVDSFEEEMVMMCKSYAAHATIALCWQNHTFID